ncbi:uncharacterized protein KY384_005773 [Bacidia gigantensis]|uniref:uncharacterized protein n=1 Tax=Bacidia gigantensis TaxID=2732470 RepID=UPI001D04B779|nr:uncharacterized protein KY384_005773 [Bacidia gigantensis]KAG8529138.1 hypothetical protein KY384_005773 [Bacidia gigantensis]
MAALPPSAHKHQHSGLIVVLKDHARIESGSPVQHIIDRHQCASNPIFGSNVELSAEHSHLAKYHRVHVAPEKFEEPVAELNAHDDVDAAYIKPAGTPPVVQVPIAPITTAIAQTKNFTDHQNHLNPGPVGVDALTAHIKPGGQGDGVNIIDCERGWQLTHEDLQVNVASLVYGAWVRGLINHGTSVVGVVKGDLHPYRITGTALNAIVRAAAFGLEQMDCAACPDQLAVVHAAVKKGVIVVEAAGDGEQDLDNTIYDVIPLNLGKFPDEWKNPLNPKNKDVKGNFLLGAILVGAGCPPPETHGNINTLDGFGWKLGPDSSRCSFSNYGARVDCQAQGWQVTTTGGGDLKKDQGVDRFYTDIFGGTSSASPIIVGVLASIQGMLKQARRELITLDQAVKLLRDTRSPQQDGALENNGPTLFPKTQRTGNRPDLKQLIGVLNL